MEIKAGNARGGEGGSIGLLSGSSKGLQSGKCSRVQTNLETWSICLNSLVLLPKELSKSLLLTQEMAGRRGI